MLQTEIKIQDVRAILEKYVLEKSEASSTKVRWWNDSELTRIYSSAHRYAQVLNFIPKSSTSLRVLEIGIGFGHLAILCKGIFAYSVAGIDCEFTEGLKLRFEEEGIEFKRCDLAREPIPFQDSLFDVTLFCDTLHLLPMRPENAFKEISRVLKDEGILILDTPNYLSLYNRLKVLFGKAQANWSKDYPHFRYYTLAELKHLLREANFDIEECHFCNFWNTCMPTIELSKKKKPLFYLYRLPCKLVPSFRDTITIKAKKS